jgi:ferredoxin-like protein FixX
MIGFQGKTMTSETEALIRTIRPGGVILFGRNIENAEQLTKLIQDLQDLSMEVTGLPMLVSTDQEGGKTVQTFLCPAGAISKVGEEGIAIDKERCLGCLLCVRNCFRVRKSEANIALWVEPMPEPDPRDLENAIPETHFDMFTVRQKTALDYKWTKFQYDV